jgi:hypothetical protein
MTRYIKRGGKVWINIFPDKPVTQKPAETRMGSGKGNPEHWVAVVKPGRVMFELSGVPENTAREAMRLAMHKLPDQDAFVLRQEEADDQPPELRELNDTESSTGWVRRRKSCSTSASRTPPVSSTTSRASRRSRRTLRASRPCSAHARSRLPSRLSRTESRNRG